jgi:hypothetical protein
VPRAGRLLDDFTLQDDVLVVKYFGRKKADGLGGAGVEPAARVVEPIAPDRSDGPDVEPPATLCLGQHLGLVIPPLAVSEPHASGVLHLLNNFHVDGRTNQADSK